MVKIPTAAVIQIPLKLMGDSSGLWLKHINGNHRCASMSEYINQFSHLVIFICFTYMHANLGAGRELKA